MKRFINFVYIGAIVAVAGGIATAGETRVVYRNDGRSGYHVQRVMADEPTTMAVYPKGKNVQVVVTVADQKIGSFSGAQGRSGYSYPIRSID